jgi:hypothetical protein
VLGHVRADRTNGDDVASRIDSTSTTGTENSEYPPLTKPARIYVFEKELSYHVREWTTGSRFVLYDDGTFSLQYLYSLGQHEYKGPIPKTAVRSPFSGKAGVRPVPGARRESSAMIR